MQDNAKRIQKLMDGRESVEDRSMDLSIVRKHLKNQKTAMQNYQKIIPRLKTWVWSKMECHPINVNKIGNSMQDNAKRIQ